MKRNHFIFSYAGNKRNETEHFLKYASFKNIENIFELFCGSSAISFHIWLKFKDKFNYYLNDNNKKLIEVYELLKTKSIEEIENEINKIKNSIETKKEWDEYYKDKENESIYKFIFFSKYSSMRRLGMFPLIYERQRKSPFQITEYQKEFIEFIKSPNVFISCGSWFELFNKHKDDETSLFIFDPPYINTCNDFYIEKNLNIYQYLYDNKIESFQSRIYLILEDIWLIRLLFMNNKILFQYDKTYGISKKETKHILIEK